MTIFRYEASSRQGRGVSSWLIGAVAMILLLIGGVFLRARSFDRHLPPTLTASSGMPVTLPDGSRTTLGSLIEPGKPTVINLWASWCGPCRKEAPTIVELQRRFGKSINLILANVRDDAASPEDLNHYLSEVGLPKNKYVRLEQGSIALVTGADNILVPRTLVYGRTGVPLAAVTGYKPLALARIAGLVE